MKTIRAKLLTGALAAITLMCAGAEQQPAARDAQRREMKKLEWWIGHWKGSGWIQTGPNERHEFTQTEKIESKLDGLVMVVEGEGKSKEDGVIVHTALALVSYDAHAKKFRWHSFTPDGQIATEAKVTDKSLEWTLEIPKQGRMRYTITKNDQGEWFEIGEMSDESGKWRKFFEMTLRKNDK
jgi:hypothetical protein